MKFCCSPIKRRNLSQQCDDAARRRRLVLLYWSNNHNYPVPLDLIPKTTCPWSLHEIFIFTSEIAYYPVDPKYIDPLHLEICLLPVQNPENHLSAIRAAIPRSKQTCDEWFPAKIKETQRAESEKKEFTQKWMRHKSFSAWGIQTGPFAAL